MTHASSSANQSKSEPFPAGPSASETETPGTPGADDAPALRSQVPTGGGGQGDPATVPAAATSPAPGTSEQAPVVQGVHTEAFPEPDPRS